MKSWRLRTLGGVLALALMSSACFGPFNATRQVYDWNKDVGGKWAQEGVFLVFAILPVYGLAMLGDAVIFNSIEFWTGDNPIDAPGMARADVKSFEQDGRTVTLERVASAEGKSMKVTVEQDGCIAQQLTLVAAEGEPTRLEDADGKLIALAQTLPDGRVRVLGAQGQELGRF